MNSKRMSITPKLATEWLAEMRKRMAAGTHKQQPIRPSKVQRFAVAMSRGAFIGMNGDRIRFDEKGNLIDGQHRLEAIVLSGVTLEMEVAFGIQSHVNGVNVMDTIDTESRKIGVRLYLSDGITCWKRAAAIAKAISFIATRKTLPQDITQARDILNIFSKEIDEVVSICGSGQKEMRSWFIGTIIWAAKVNRQKALEFATNYVTMENLPKGHPALALRAWVGNTIINNGFGGRERQIDAVCSALRLHFNGEYKSRIVATKPSHDWLLQRSPSLTRKIIEISTPPEFLKLAA